MPPAMLENGDEPVRGGVASARPDAHEAPLTLDEPAPRVLSFWDQSAFWANLGVSLFAFSGAYTVLAPAVFGLPPVTHFPRIGREVQSLGILELHTAAAFDVGVGISVYGAIVSTFDRLFPTLRGDEE